MKPLKRTFAAALGGIGLLAGGLATAAPARAATVSQGATGYGCTAYTYDIGGYSGCVGYIQRINNGEISSGNYYGGLYLAVDNSFGPNTETSVARFQSYYGLAADGVVGPNTWNQLCGVAGSYLNQLSYATAAEKDEWQAAYDAGCYVQKVDGNGHIYSISKY